MYLADQHKVWLATGSEPVYLEPSMANRHGLIAGATGTGKTVTLKVLAESFSDMGVPTFIADIKGDLSGMCQPGVENKHIRRSIDTMGLADFTYRAYPVRFFDIFGKKGHPVRTTVSEMGPELLSRLLGLNDTQSGIMRIVFRVADEKGLLLIDLKDLSSMLRFIAENANEYKLIYGNISSQSVGAIQRSLLALRDQGGDAFFGEPDLDIKDWFDWDEDGKGIMNILECQELFQSPVVYSTFLLWMLTELYEILPEDGDLDKPKIAFFFDEAHLLFKDAPKALLDKIEQVVRLIRSKGVSVWFITQNPSDISESVLAQIGNRVQHALRAYTPNEQKAIRAAAQSFRENPAFDTQEALQQLAVGEALVSCLDVKGVPSVVERANILPPHSSMEIVPDEVIRMVVASSPLCDKYSQTEDRESAYELLEVERKEIEEAKAKEAILAEQAKAEEKARKEAEKEAERARKEAEKRAEASRKKTSKYVNKVVNSAANTIGREVGKKLARGLFDILIR